MHPVARSLLLTFTLTLTVVVGAIGAPAAGSAETPPAPPAPDVEAEGPDWLPLQGTVELWCTQSNPGYGGCSGHHDEPALDIGVPTGTPVYAAGPGTVETADTGGGGRGTYVDLRHPDGTSSHYYHLSELSVAEGRDVERGELLGRSGSTGSSTAPHLHYEERGLDGRPRPVGPLYGRVGKRVVSYPEGLFGADWATTPYGTLLTNHGYPPVDRPGAVWVEPGEVAWGLVVRELW